MRIPCNACCFSCIQDMKYCHECRGLGYIEHITRLPGCTSNTFTKECPIHYEFMTGGWECSACGESGPITQKLIDHLLEIGNPCVKRAEPPLESVD